MTNATNSMLASRYRLESCIGRGGMGEVWSATDTRVGRAVAVKCLRPDVLGSLKARARFTREARALALLQSANVVRLYDYGVDNGQPYLVMERLRGTSLHARLRACCPLDASELKALARGTARGLTDAHAAGLVHRDLKPGNIFLCSPSLNAAWDEVKLLDFGIARILSSSMAADEGELTEAGAFLGSRHYVSPEAIMDARTAGAASDIWSFAVVLHLAQSGKFPFEDADASRLETKIRRESPAIAPEIPPGMVPFFKKALARKPDDRFQSVAEMGCAFERAMEECEREDPTRISTPQAALEAPADETGGSRLGPVVHGAIAGGLLVFAIAVLLSRCG